MNRKEKRKFNLFNKRVDSMINFTRNNEDYSETKKTALIKADLDKFYSSKDIYDIDDFILLERINRLMKTNKVLYENGRAIITGIIGALLVKLIDIQTESLIIQFILIFLIIFVIILSIKSDFSLFSTFNNPVNTEIYKYEIELIRKELYRREATHKE